MINNYGGGDGVLVFLYMPVFRVMSDEFWVMSGRFSWYWRG